jgi:hypothetical protein
VSLSQDPALSALKQAFVCGYRDISNEPYAGASGLHEKDGKAINTSNGAGPHNIQMFILAPDGTVLTCLPGFWNPQDLVNEMQLAEQLNTVWTDPHLSRSQKDQTFRQMHLAHIQEHSQATVRRSRMQSFDQKYEAEHRLNRSDTIRDRGAVAYAINSGGKMPQNAFKTTDEIFHERMAMRPFVAYEHFDVAAFADYGKPKYDKHEDARDASGQVDKIAARNAPTIGNTDMDKPMRRRRGYQPEQESGNNSNANAWGTNANAWGTNANAWGTNNNAWGTNPNGGNRQWGSR